jgi:hypothetical protein
MGAWRTRKVTGRLMSPARGPSLSHPARCCGKDLLLPTLALLPRRLLPLPPAPKLRPLPPPVQVTLPKKMADAPPHLACWLLLEEGIYGAMARMSELEGAVPARDLLLRSVLACRRRPRSHRARHTRRREWGCCCPGGTEGRERRGGSERRRGERSACR